VAILYILLEPFRNQIKLFLSLVVWEYETFADVVERIPEFIEEVYNRKRVHSGIQYLPPEEFEAILQDEKRKQFLGQVSLKLPG
jgi:transposase InsO family protein